MRDYRWFRADDTLIYFKDDIGTGCVLRHGAMEELILKKEIEAIVNERAKAVPYVPRNHGG